MALVKAVIILDHNLKTNRATLASSRTVALSTLLALFLLVASGFTAASFPKRVLTLDLLARAAASLDVVAGSSGVEVQQPHFWQDYERLIILVAVVCVLEAALIYVLLRERRRRRRLQRRLEERVRFEQLISEMTSTLINLPPEKVEAQIS